MIDQKKSRRRLFTVEQANATLPLVSRIVSDLVQLARDVSERSERLSLLLAGREAPRGDDLYEEELAQSGDQLAGDHQQLREYVDELLDIGIEPTSAIEGLVDYTSIVDGRIAYLCWKLGDPEVLYWHDLDDDCMDRRPLDSHVTAENQPVGAGQER